MTNIAFINVKGGRKKTSKERNKLKIKYIISLLTSWKTLKGNIFFNNYWENVTEHAVLLTLLQTFWCQNLIVLCQKDLSQACPLQFMLLGIRLYVNLFIISISSRDKIQRQHTVVTLPFQTSGMRIVNLESYAHDLSRFWMKDIVSGYCR